MASSHIPQQAMPAANNNRRSSSASSIPPTSQSVNRPQQVSNLNPQPIQPNSPSSTPVTTTANTSSTAPAGSPNSSPATSITSIPSATSISAPARQPNANTSAQQIPSTNSTSVPPPASTTPSNVTAARKKRLYLARYWALPILAFSIYALTLGIAASASARYTLLGRVSAPLGTWFLAVLAKLGDITFAFAVADAFDCLAWGRLRRKGASSGVQSAWFLAVTPSTGVAGLCTILRRSVKSLLEEKGSWYAGHTGFRKRSSQRWRRWKNVRWGLGRLLFVLVLIPGPGIILMANIDQKNVFFDTKSMTVSGGIAPYNPSLAMYSGVVGADISRLAQMMLGDRSISWPVKPADPKCKASKTCTSYLIGGPYRTVQPWPFTIENDNTDGFRLHNAPFYQVDLWNNDDGSEPKFNDTEDCTLYGGLNPSSEFSMVLCMRSHSENTLVAAWRSCQSNYTLSPPRCHNASVSPSPKAPWTTYLHFHRRTATLTFSRSTFTILSATELSRPSSQSISAQNLFTATDAMLYRPDLASNDPRYDRTSHAYQLTQQLGSTLWFALHGGLAALTIGNKWLQNILTLPVYLFQPTLITTADNDPTASQRNGSTVLLSLPDENYVKGAYCVVSKRAVPGWETVLGYAIAVGMLLGFVVWVKWRAWKWQGSEGRSDFPMVDFGVIGKTVGKDGREISVKDKVTSSGRDYGSRRVLDEMRDVRIVINKV